MHKYKVTFALGQGIKFESKHHISTMEVMPLPMGSYLNFEDAGIVLDLAQVKKMEIDGVEYKLRAYKI